MTRSAEQAPAPTLDGTGPAGPAPDVGGAGPHLCRNCGWQDARPTVDLCWPCYDYEHRTGRPRPAEVVLRHLARVIARDLEACR